MKPSELQEKTCHQFDCAIKTVIRHRAIDFYRAIRRSEKKEMPFAEIMDDLLNSIGTEDTYSTDYVAVFEVCGENPPVWEGFCVRAITRPVRHAASYPAPHGYRLRGEAPSSRNHRSRWSRRC